MAQPTSGQGLRGDINPAAGKKSEAMKARATKFTPLGSCARNRSLCYRFWRKASTRTGSLGTKTQHATAAPRDRTRPDPQRHHDGALIMMARSSP